MRRRSHLSTRQSTNRHSLNHPVTVFGWTFAALQHDKMPARNQVLRFLYHFSRMGPGRLSRRGLTMTSLLVGLMATGISSAGAASGLTQVDPATVPQGELALESRTHTPFTLDVAGHDQDFRKGADVTVEHFQFAATGDPNGNDVSGWHKHGGPVFVEVVTGTLTVYQAKDEKCHGKRYPAGTGFVEPGGVVHDARNEGAGTVDIYDTVVLPPGSGDGGIFIPEPDFSNRDCSFAK
jgi:quercetin dioxygenase-like cupin family protein